MRLSTLFITSIVILALAIGFVFVTRGAGAESARGRLFWDEQVASYVRRKVASSYVDKLTAEQQREAFYRAMDAYVELDVYCEFIPPAKHKDWREDIAGRYAGLGVKIEQVEDGLTLVGVFPGGPAAKAGLVVGDTLTHANKTPLAGIDIEDVAKVLKGKSGTRVTVRVISGPRPEKGPHTGPGRLVVIRRGVIRRPTVFSRTVGPGGIYGHIRLTDFAEETVRDFDRAVDRHLAAGVKGLLLDLRGNGGGVLNAALEIADRFLAKGIILRMEGRGVDANKQHRARAQKDDVLELPLIVLVNGGSASASEVVSGALQDHRRAVLVGQRTYGKFLVQQITEIPRTRAALKLTTSRYYTPSGRSYQAPRRDPRMPIDPDAEPAGLFPDVIEVLDAAGRENLAKFWAEEEGRAWNQERRFPDIPEDYVDPQLERALQMLSGGVALRSIRRGRQRDG